MSLMILCNSIEGLVQLIFGVNKIQVDWESLVRFLSGEEEVILLEGCDGGIMKDDDKWIIYTPINIEYGNDNSEDNYDWLKDWEEGRFLLYPEEHVKKVPALKRYGGKVIV